MAAKNVTFRKVSETEYVAIGMTAKNVTFRKVSETEYAATGNWVFGTGPYTTAAFPAPALFAYNNGAFIQDALPMLSDSDREFILSGISPKGWEAMEKEEV